MSHYSCPICSGSTSVIETRLSKGRLRRRRRCPANHRFSTIELPHETAKRVTRLITWLGKQGLCPDIASYASEQLQEILAGIPEETEEPIQPQEPDSHAPSDQSFDQSLD